MTRAGKMFYAYYGTGSRGHFVGELFKMAAQIDVVHVPYKGETPALCCRARYRQRLFQPAARAAIQDAFVRSRSQPESARPALRTCPRSRSRAIPRWAALMAPARTPSAIVQQLTREISAIVMRPDVQAKMAELGLDTVGWDAPRTQAFLAQQLEATRKMVALGRIRI